LIGYKDEANTYDEESSTSIEKYKTDQIKEEVREKVKIIRKERDTYV